MSRKTESSTWTAGRIRELEQKLAVAELEIELRDGVLSMVEGNPTGRLNFLQRVYELIAIEARQIPKEKNEPHS